MENLIKKALEVGNIPKAKKLITAMYQQQDKQAWDKARSDEYDVLYPKHREIETEEGTELETIDYISEDSMDYDVNFMYYKEWLNETKVISEAVEATYDEEGLELTPYQPEVTEMVRPYTALEVTDEMVETKLNEQSGYAEYKESVYTKQVEDMMVGYPQYERDTFECQEREAREWTVDNTASTPMLDAIAASREVDKAELVSKILAKSDMFKAAVGSVIGAKQKELG